MTESLRLYDNTRVSAFKRCARYFYFRHVRHWETDTKKPALAFGSAWHKAQEYIWEWACKQPFTIGKSDLIDEAYSEFVKDWIAEGMPSPHELDYEASKALGARTPANAYEMISAYVDKRWSLFEDGVFEMIAIEQPFAVPLDKDDAGLFYIGKIDKIVRRRGKVLGIEHKTTTAYKATQGSGQKFRNTFLDSFSPNSQVDGYLFALRLMFPGQVGGVWVDGALVHRSEQDFTFIPVERHLDQLDGWLWETRTWIDQIEANKALLSEISEDAPYMAAFPKNTNSCFDFNVSCPYIDICKARANPIGLQTPPGFDEVVWDPLDHVRVDTVEDLLSLSEDIEMQFIEERKDDAGG